MGTNMDDALSARQFFFSGAIFHSHGSEASSQTSRSANRYPRENVRHRLVGEHGISSVELVRPLNDFTATPAVHRAGDILWSAWAQSGPQQVDLSGYGADKSLS